MSDGFHILLAVELQCGMVQLLAEATRYGRALNAIVDIVHVALQDPDFIGYPKSDRTEKPTQEDMIRDSTAKELRSARRQTQAIGAKLRASGVRIGQVLTVQGPFPATLLEHVRDLHSSLLIVGSHTHSALHRLWYGDTIKDLTLWPPCALLVVPIDSE